MSRHGGDEFLYLLMKFRQDSDASPIAEKIVASISAPIELNSENRLITVSVGCSVGISIFPRKGSTGSTLIAGADRAMYQAKRAGGGYAYDPGDPEVP